MLVRLTVGLTPTCCGFSEMQWLAFGSILLHLTGCIDAGALKCVFDTRDSSCITEKKDISPSQNLIKQDTSFQSSDAECLAGTEWESNCYSCHCSLTGEAECVRKTDCISKGLAEPLRCKPNSTFRRDCNTCTCLENGEALCTLIGCLNRVKKEAECEPGTTFKKECNTCSCTSEGRLVCTRKGCLGSIAHNIQKRDTGNTGPIKKPNAKVVCVANRMFIKDCNTCWCNEDGTSFFCTRRVCVEKPGDTDEGDPMVELTLRDFKKDCTPNMVFEMDCNMCRCNPDGKSYSCTRRACVDIDDKNTTMRKSRATPEKPKTCTPGQEFRLDCNKCLCNDVGEDFSCTRLDCNAVNNGAVATVENGARKKRATTQQIQLECSPGSVFDRECNVCRCTEDGHHASCTLRRCSKVGDASTTTEATPSFRCTPGDQFKRDCNDCTCSADGKNVFCTLRLCDEDLANVEA